MSVLNDGDFIMFPDFVMFMFRKIFLITVLNLPGVILLFISYYVYHE